MVRPGELHGVVQLLLDRTSDEQLVLQVQTSCALLFDNDKNKNLSINLILGVIVLAFLDKAACLDADRLSIPYARIFH